MSPLARTLIVIGAVLVLLGLALHWSPGLPPLGRLPGDIRIERPGMRLFLPITSCLVVSAALTAIFWLASRWR